MSFGTLAHFYNGQGLKGDWFISRKYNGHGAIWDGSVTRGMLASEFPFYKRGGDKCIPVSTGLWGIGRDGGAKVIHAPMEWVMALPIGIPLHGELWKDDDLNFVQSVCTRKKDINYGAWNDIKFIPFNVKPYETWDFGDLSKSYLKKNKYYKNASWKELYLKAIEEITNAGVIHFPKFEKATKEKIAEYTELVKTLNWEGFMLQRIDAAYECKRSYNVLKYKPVYDAEAEILDFVVGEKNNYKSLRAEVIWDEKILRIPGGNKGMIGKKVEFSVSGLNQNEHDNLPDIYSIGDEIGFTFLSVSNYGVPNSPNIKRS